MKNILFTFLMLALVILVRAQEFSNASLQSMVDTELAFSKAAKEKNTREAFLSYLNDESLSFSEGEIRAAKKHWENTPVGTEWLYWLPVFADISSSGDFGYTTGSWNYRTAKTAESPVGFGEFVSIWKKQPEGAWKIAVDVGVNHGEYPVDGHPLRTSSIKTKAVPKAKAKDFKKELLDAENLLISALTGTPLAAYQQWASKEIKFFREGSLTLTTAEEATKDAEETVITVTDVQVAPSGDMGFTYGTITAPPSPGIEPKTRKFIRIWKKEDGKNWKIVVDLVS